MGVVLAGIVKLDAVEKTLLYPKPFERSYDFLVLPAARYSGPAFPLCICGDTLTFIIGTSLLWNHSTSGWFSIYRKERTGNGPLLFVFGKRQAWHPIAEEVPPPGGHPPDSRKSPYPGGISAARSPRLPPGRALDPPRLGSPPKAPGEDPVPGG